MVFNFSGHVSAASLHVEFLVGYFIGAEYTTDLPQAAIVERAHVIVICQHSCLAWPGCYLGGSWFWGCRCRISRSVGVLYKSCVLVQICAVLSWLISLPKLHKVANDFKRFIVYCDACLCGGVDGHHFGFGGGIDDEACLYGILGESIRFSVQMFCICGQDSKVICKVKIFKLARESIGCLNVYRWLFFASITVRNWMGERMQRGCRTPS